MKKDKGYLKKKEIINKTMKDQYEEVYVDGKDEPIYKCKRCKTIIKREENLKKHLSSKTHIDYEANTYFWHQRTKKYLEEPFQSLLSPNIRIERK